MILSKDTSCQVLEIWSPKWKDRTVLLAKFKVGTHNIVKFLKAKSMPGEYYVSGEEARKHPIVNNGKLDCYAVPMDKLEKLERI